MKATNHQHLSDERLISTYFEGAGGRPRPDAVDAECDHVRTCDACARRLRELTASLERLREHAVAEADAYFTADRLAAQQERIIRHLEGAEHPARVIPFPHPPATVRAPGVRHPVYRWVAAAAAAGLLIGVAAGRLLYVQPDLSSRAGRDTPAASSVQARSAQPVQSVPGSVREPLTGNPSRDEVLLWEIEDAVRQPQVSGLRALDALTPRVQEASVRLK